MQAETAETKRKADAKTEKLREQAMEILAYLNDRACHHYSPVGVNLRRITARLKSGLAVEVLKGIIDLKVQDWLGDPKMEKYLRPDTLFGAKKCASYAGEVQAGPKTRGRDH